MSTLTALEARIAALLSERMAREVPSADTDLIAAGAMDSTAFVELLHLLEEEFGLLFRLEDLDIDHFRSISRIAAVVRNMGGGQKLAEPRSYGDRSTVL
jgi:methoxymalonate biosynthesis acyl carrier protein